MSVELGRGLAERLVREAQERVTWGSHAVQNAEMAVLTGPRSGRMDGSHQASAPGEAPAEETGQLRGTSDGGWFTAGWVEATTDGWTAHNAILPADPSAPYVRWGDPDLPGSQPFQDPNRIRHYVQRIKALAMAELREIYSRPWL